MFKAIGRFFRFLETLTVWTFRLACILCIALAVLCAIVLLF